MIYGKRTINGKTLKYRGIYKTTKKGARAQVKKVKGKYPSTLVRMIPRKGKFGKLKGRKVYLQYTSK